MGEKKMARVILEEVDTPFSNTYGGLRVVKCEENGKIIYEGRMGDCFGLDIIPISKEFFEACKREFKENE